MIEIRQTDAYTKWYNALRDQVARTRIKMRLRHLTMGHFGDSKSVGQGVFELRVHCGPGYRIYFHRRGEELIILLAGGDKGSQQRDIAKAMEMAKTWREPK
jgi:putative addiction module killer protein